MKKAILFFLLFFSLHLYSQEAVESPISNRSNLELFVEAGGNNAQFNLPTTGFEFTKLSGYGVSFETGLLLSRLDPNQPLDLVGSGRIGYSSFNLQSDVDTLDFNRSVKGLYLEGGFGLHHRQILYFTLNLGYFKSLSNRELTGDSLFGDIRVLVKIPTNAGISFGLSTLVGGLFNNVVFKEFRSEGLFYVKGGLVVSFRI